MLRAAACGKFRLRHYVRSSTFRKTSIVMPQTLINERQSFNNTQLGYMQTVALLVEHTRTIETINIKNVAKRIKNFFLDILHPETR